MTVPSQTPKVTHTANGTTKSFAFTFRVRKTSHLSVYVDSTLKTLGTHYTVTSTNLAAGGTVVFVTAPANGAKVRIYRNMPYSRTDFDYQTSGTFPAATINEDLDSLALQVQQIAESVNRSVTVGLFSDGVSTSLPSPSSLKFLRWNSAGNALENADASVGAVLASAVHKAEQQTAAEGQTVFNLTNSYLPGTNSLQVEMNNAILASGIDYTETSATSITLVDPAYADDFLVFKTISFVNSPASDSASVSYTPAGSGAVATNVQDKLRSFALSPSDYKLPADPDDSASFRRLAALLQTAGGGAVDFGSRTYVLFSGTHSADPETLFNLTGLSGLIFKSDGATFTSSGNFPVANVRAVIFEFTNCVGVDFQGTFNATYTGDRGVTSGDSYLAMYQRGLVFAKFWTGNKLIKGCNLNISDISVGVWYNNFGDQANGTRLIHGWNIVADEVGYPWLTDKSGHQATGIKIYATNSGRICLLQDVDGPSDFYLVSANHRASTDFGFSGNISHLRFVYVNTQSTGASLGRCVQLNYPVDTGRVLKDVKGSVYVATSGGTYTSYAFKAGYAVGVASVASDYIVDGLDVSVNVVSDTANQQGIQFEHPTQWTDGANIRNLRIHDTRLQGGGLCALDLRGVAGNAIIENIESESNLQVQGNSIGVVTCRKVKATTICNSGDTSHVFLDNCENTSSTFGSAGKVLTNTYINGVLWNTPVIHSQALQTFTVRILNNAGTLQHQILNLPTASSAAGFAGKISGADINPNTTPDVSGGATALAAGAGINGNELVLDTSGQTNANAFVAAFVEKYDGSVSTPAVAAVFVSMAINGVTRNRLHLRLTNALSGADWTLNTTNIPSGKSVYIKFIGYLA